MSKQRKQHQAAKECRACRKQNNSTLPAHLPTEESTQLIVVETIFTFPNGTSIGDYHIVEIPVSTTYEQYRQGVFEYRCQDYPEAKLSIEFHDIDEAPTDGSLPDGMTFRSVWMLGGPLA